MPDPIQTTLFRCLQEALTNAARYAQAKVILITLTQEDDTIIMVVKDDGIGFSSPMSLQHRESGGTGISGMRERLLAIKGHLQIETAPGKGTEIIIQTPIN